MRWVACGFFLGIWGLVLTRAAAPLPVEFRDELFFLAPPAEPGEPPLCLLVELFRFDRARDVRLVRGAGDRFAVLHEEHFYSDAPAEQIVVNGPLQIKEER